ncbi:thioesterase II family protein [Streptomyces olivaceoviridis]|uniref:thioesterase II family protein n=1 Tax=Streptomyces olivaceoviridis TaxID=1921 RepID=UPI0036FBCF64
MHLFAPFGGATAVSRDGRGGTGAADVRLYCFPYAGGGTQVFRGWQSRLTSRVPVVGVRLPGREQRFREPAHTSWDTALAELTAAFAPLSDQGPYAFFGHSLGARLAYELAHRLVDDGRRPPELLVVSGCRGPGRPPRHPDMHSLDGPALRARLRAMNGVPPEVLDNRPLMDLLEPMLRSDLRLAETWRPTSGRLPVPVLALCGDHDDVDPYEDMLDWQHHTWKGFAIHSFPAGHFFLREQEPAVVKVIAERLRGGTG